MSTSERTEFVARLEQLAECVHVVSYYQSRIAQLQSQRVPARTYNRLIPGAKVQANRRLAKLNRTTAHIDSQLALAVRALRLYYESCGGNDFYPQEYLERNTISQIAALIRQHRADSVGQSLNTLRQEAQDQKQRVAAQAAANRRHRQNLAQRRQLANRAIFYDMWR
ncbi:hypothetical protein [Rhodococcus sp. 27YEA15]|uniref:hypothetical protein n=1 Tax=Rhodococcus sp. 27YEA15 TaxID=3156259 RepID=UPI003C7DDD45